MENINLPEMLPLVGCGILAEEIRFLIKKNSWNVDPHFLHSSLHVDFKKLEVALTSSFEKLGEGPKTVVYGACHPLMDRIVEDGNAHRSKGQNCVELLLGREIFDDYLFQGAFFLLEDWAEKWEEVMAKAFGSNPEIIREILGNEHKFLLCIRTPCSKDFTRHAERISLYANLPLRWHDADLSHLELILENMIKESRNKDGK
ncbi:MAG: DUF1638 domain-containing protein [Spirochaetales bacterium]|nr:DUF1638 domain-containing protein [Spirochaetales bacterium]